MPQSFSNLSSSILNTYLDASQWYFYPSLFLLLLLAGLGMPISADLVLLFCGYLAFQSKASAVVMIVIAICAILTSDVLMFYIGKKFGRKLTQKAPFNKIFTESKITQAELSFQKQGYKTVFFSRFMPGIRTVFMFTSGLLNLNVFKFVLHDLAGALIVIPFTILSVTWVAGNVDQILQSIKKAQGFVLIAAALFFIVWIVRKNNKKPTI